MIFQFDTQVSISFPPHVRFNFGRLSRDLKGNVRVFMIAKHGSEISRKWSLSTHLDRIMEAKVHTRASSRRFFRPGKWVTNFFYAITSSSLPTTKPPLLSRPALPHNATIDTLLRLRTIHRSSASLTTYHLN